MTFQLAVCAEMVFQDLPLLDRVERIHELGFAVEIWSWHDKDLAALAATGATFTSMTGYLHGDLIDPQSCDEVVRTAELSVTAAEALGVTRLNLHTAELVDGRAARPRYRADGRMWATALRTLERIGELGARAGVTFCVENLNTVVDHPGVPLARAKDTLALVEGVGHAHVKMMLDLYTRRSARETSASSCDGAATPSARSRSPTSRAAANPAPERSTIRRSPQRCATSATPAPSAWRVGPHSPAHPEARPR